MMAATLLWMGCGGGNNQGGGGGPMTASIDGQGFSADQVATANATTTSGVVAYTLTGGRGTSGSNFQVISITLWNIPGPGTYPLGVNATNFGGIASYTEGSTSWTTPINGTAGTITISTLGSGRIAGTFSFTSAQVQNPSSTKHVTNGSFDLALTGTPGTVQPYQGSSLRANLGGTDWIGGTIVTVAKTSGVYSFGASSQTGGGGAGLSTINITLGGVNGPATFQIGGTGVNVNQVSVVVNSASYNSSLSGSSGSVVVTSVDANRLKGTFTGTIASGGGPALTVINGTFDIGLGPP
jgi:hypothetical protein